MLQKASISTYAQEFTFPIKKIRKEFNNVSLGFLFPMILKNAERTHIKDEATVIYLTTILSYLINTHMYKINKFTIL